MEFVKKCDRGQRYADLHKAPLENLRLVSSPWSFHMWRVDILGPNSHTLGQVKFFIVVVDYFTKQVEVEPDNLLDRLGENFYQKKIICRFRIPTTIVSNNRTQFVASRVVEICSQLKIMQIFTSVEHPHTLVWNECCDISKDWGTIPQGQLLSTREK